MASVIQYLTLIHKLMTLNIESIKKFFWDIDFTKLNWQKDKRYVIERILENGDDQAVAQLLHSYSKEEIVDVVVNSRRLSSKTGNYWRIKLNISEQIRCLQTQSQNPLSKLWN